MCHFGLVISFCVNQNASGYIQDQCCRPQRGGASLLEIITTREILPQLTMIGLNPD